MSETLSVFRTEKKYELNGLQKSILVNKLSSIMKLDENGDQNGYLVRSLYFDSIYDDDYFDKVNGLENRKKIRLRIYSPDQKMVKLEIKQKNGAAQLKKSIWISKALAEEMINGNYVGLLELESELAIEIYQILERGVYRPKCIIEYNRIAFMEETNDIRITFDSDISVSMACQDFFKHDLSLMPIMNKPVLEVKYNGFLLSNLKQIVNIANASEMSISKYALCRQMLY